MQRGRAPSGTRPRALGRMLSAGERLLGLQARDGAEVAQDRGELLGGPRLAAVAAVLAVAGEAEAAAGLVLGDREVPGGGVAVAGAARGAEAQAPAGDDDRVAVVADLADLEHRRLTTPAHGALPSTVPSRGAGTRCCELFRLSAEPGGACMRGTGDPSEWGGLSSSSRYRA